MRKTKIICTLGPASQSAEVLEGMLHAGMDVARLNFSHGTHEEHAERVDLLREVARRVGRPLAILQDIQGPKIRLGKFEGGQITVKKGDRVVVTTRPLIGSEGLIPTPIKSLPRDVKKGHPILLDDGRVRLRVDAVRGQDVRCTVEIGGILKDKKGLNLPGAAMSVPTITPKDRRDLLFGQEIGVDYVALSFVRSPKDLAKARALVLKNKTPLIAKIEKPQAMTLLEEIAAVSDGVMVARGDLGVEMPLEQLPTLQKYAVRLVNSRGGLVIVATEMLESMVSNSRPTRAEVSDVANAVLDGADAVMLSGETAAGRYPVEAVATMSRIVEETELHAPPRGPVPSPFATSHSISAGVAAAAVAAADQLGADTIVTYTESGGTAQLMSQFRPRARIVGLTPNPESVRRMALYWGVEPRLVDRCMSTDDMVQQVRAICREDRRCRPGNPVVIVAGVPLNQPGKTNTMIVHRI